MTIFQSLGYLLLVPILCLCEILATFSKARALNKQFRSIHRKRPWFVSWLSRNDISVTYIFLIKHTFQCWSLDTKNDLLFLLSLLLLFFFVFGLKSIKRGDSFWQPSVETICIILLNFFQDSYNKFGSKNFERPREKEWFSLCMCARVCLQMRV